MLNSIMNTAGIFDLIALGNTSKVSYNKWKELKALILSNDKLMKQFVSIVFTYNANALYTELLNMLADNNIITIEEANYNNTGEFKI